MNEIYLFIIFIWRVNLLTKKNIYLYDNNNENKNIWFAVFAYLYLSL